MIRQNQEIQYVLQKNMAHVSELEKEQHFNQERIKDTAHGIEFSRTECSDLDTHKYTIR